MVTPVLCDGNGECFRLADRVAQLEALLRETRRTCTGPFCVRGYTDAQPQCTCGADAWNARVDAVLTDSDETP